MRLAALALLVGLTACGGGGALGPSRSVECAPFARAVTGIRLYGPADGWWDQAAGRYRTSQVPLAGGVLVFARSARLPSGHVSVVSAVLSKRDVLLTQANWLHGRIGIDQPARDVSAANDWTSVRVFWPPSGTLGRTVYPTYGFILPETTASRRAIAATARDIAQRGIGAGAGVDE